MQCSVYGSNVQLFYFPPKTTGASPPSENSNLPAMVQSYAPGITFTSPSIYLSFDYLKAYSTTASLGTICRHCEFADAPAGRFSITRDVFDKVGLGAQTTGTTIACAILSKLHCPSREHCSAGKPIALLCRLCFQITKVLTTEPKLLRPRTSRPLSPATTTHKPRAPRM